MKGSGGACGKLESKHPTLDKAAQPSQMLLCGNVSRSFHFSRESGNLDFYVESYWGEGRGGEISYFKSLNPFDTQSMIRDTIYVLWSTRISK